MKSGIVSVDSLLYCSEKVAPFGSSNYYALLWQAPKTRARVLAVLALRQELLDIPARVSDGQLALTKLNWWREELARAARGVAQHPVSNGLQPLLGESLLSLAELTSMCDGIEMLLHTGRLHDEAALLAFCRLTGGLPWQLTARIAAPGDVSGLAYAEQVGVGLQLLDAMQILVVEAQRGMILAPTSMLERHGLPVERLASAEPDEHFVALAKDMLTRSKSTLLAARQQFPGQVPAALRYLVALAAMANATMKELERSGLESLTSQHLSLTPVRKLLLAWKSRWFT